MRNVSKITKSLLLSVIILSAGIKHANAFFLIPPMPWDIEINIPGNANKVISNIKSAYRQLQALKNKEFTEILQSAKIGNLDELGGLKGLINETMGQKPESESKGENKTAGKKGILSDSELDISENSINEKEYYDAYYKLFFQLPPKSSYSGNYNVLKTAFAEKKLDYQQDVIIDTYLIGRMNEDYLVLVNETINRLDECRMGVKRDGTALVGKEAYEDYCVFFGMQFAYSDPTKEAPKGPEDTDPGSLGEQMNAYIISVMYDRMLRMVEDLTAAEAIYRAAKQIELVEPISEKTTDASDYMPNKYQFAYTSTHNYQNAKIDPTSYTGGTIIADEKRSEQCANGGEGCPTVNDSEAKEITSMEDTTILRELQPIRDLLQKAMTLHNLKSELPEYKGQYRKYLKAVEVHDRALKVLSKSDECVTDFIKRHSTSGTATNMWYGASIPAKANEYSARGGISRQILEEYQKYITDTIIEKDDGICDGFYAQGTCPVGFTSDTKNPCPDDKSKFPCIVDTVPTDMETAEADAETGNISSDADDTDGLVDATKAAQIENDNRMKAERSWRIGAEKVMELTRDGKLTFNQWNDQQDIQEKYLENKYRNIRTIIKTMDKAKASYQVATYKAKNEPSNDSNEPMAHLITKATSVKTVSEAVNDGGALNEARSKNASICAGFNCAAPNYCTKVVPTSYTERYQDTCYYTRDDGTTGSYTCTKEREETGTATLGCWAKASASAGYADVVEDTYTTGNKYKTSAGKTHYKAADLRIKNNPASYSEHIRKDPIDFAKMINSDEEKPENCYSNEWDFTITGIVRKFMPRALGGCKPTLEEQAENVYTTAHNNKRVVARDKLESVIKVKEEEEKKVKDNIRKWTAKIDKLKSEKERLVRSLETWTSASKTVTENKNQMVSLKKDATRRIEAIQNNIKLIEDRGILDIDRKKIIPTLAKDAEELARKQKEMLQTELDCIESGSSKFCKQCTNFDTCKTDVVVNQNCENADINESIQEECQGTFINLAYADGKIKTYQGSIDSYNSSIKNVKNDIKKKEEKIEKSLEEFAEDYLETAEKAQDKIEDENQKYENFVSENGYRMIVNKFKGDDGLTPTIHRAIAKKEVQPFAEEKIKEIWLSSSNVNSAASKLSSIGLPSTLIVGEELVLGSIKLPAGTYTNLAAVVNQIKGEIAEVAAKNIAKKISEADIIMEKEIKDAVQEVNNWSGKKLCLDGEGENVVNPNCKDNKNIGLEKDKYDYMKYENYTSSTPNEQTPTDGTGSITQGHMELIANLKLPSNTILKDAEVDLAKIFGIPDDSILKTDEEYFVALPARGTSNHIPTCKYNGSNYKDNNGCDYMAPREPLAITPPLREVFYFSALDFEDVPVSGKKKNPVPAISHLLNYKYPAEKFEYLPEVWRYLLARPNLREDGKYQQTYIERGYGQKEIDAYIRQFDDDNLNTITARGGIYPCRLGSYMDVKGAGSVKKIGFKTRRSAPLGAASVDCQEIKRYDGKLQHLLADFKPKAKKNPALQSYSGATSDPMYVNYSELGQFLAPHKKSQLKYRPLLKDAFALLQDVKKESTDSNNFTRQMAETVSFKRNVMGSFLENVNSELGAHKNRKKAEEDVRATLKTLCEQVEEFEVSFGSNAGTSNLEGDEKTNACVESIIKGGGLASSAEDDAYDVKPNGPRTLYSTLFLTLNDKKDENLNKAKQAFNKVKAYDKKLLDKVEERVDEIELLIKVLESDTEEKVAVHPGDTVADVKKAVKEYEAQRPLALDAEEEALLSMDNQSRSVAYCPVY